jgi:hypothetical protein
VVARNFTLSARLEALRFALALEIQNADAGIATPKPNLSAVGSK